MTGLDLRLLFPNEDTEYGTWWRLMIYANCPNLWYREYCPPINKALTTFWTNVKRPNTLHNISVSNKNGKVITRSDEEHIDSKVQVDVIGGRRSQWQSRCTICSSFLRPNLNLLLQYADQRIKYLRSEEQFG